jgi:hypothetical protein
MVVVLVGLLLLFVGIYPAAALVHFASIHMLYQFYDEYLRRGGEELPLPVEPAPAPARYDD